jgi:hypothetical protein
MHADSHRGLLAMINKALQLEQGTYRGHNPTIQESRQSFPFVARSPFYLFEYTR